MTKLGPEYRGKLPPGAAAQHRKTLASYRQAVREGVRVDVEISPPGGCLISDAQKGVVYSIDGVPSLPLPGCTRLPVRAVICQS